jgi:[acyl-carrier-protein] S-malonyltransferase
MEELTRAIHLQPALTAANLICWQQVQKKIPDLEPACMAGHSLGEYSALCAAGVLNIEDTMALVSKRGELMEREGQAHPGGMRAVLGLTVEQMEQLLDDYQGPGTVVVANHNSETQVVISGDQEGLDGVEAVCSEQGAKVIALQVSVANHSPLVAGAVADFEAFMATIRFYSPKIEVFLNVTGASEHDPEVIRRMMANQIASRVRWLGIIQAMLDNGVEAFVEVGPKKVLAGLMRKIVGRKSPIVCLQCDSPESLDKVAQQLV